LTNHPHSSAAGRGRGFVSMGDATVKTTALGGDGDAADDVKVAEFPVEWVDRLLKLFLLLELQSDTQPVSSQVGVTRAFDGLQAEDSLSLRSLVLVFKKREEEEDIVEHEAKFLKLFVLLIIVTESWIGFSSLKTPLRDPRLPSSLLLPLETVLFRGCCKKKPEEPSQDSTTTAFLFSEGF